MMLKCFLCVSLLTCATSYRIYQQRIPNGDSVPHPCKPNNIWEGVGHFIDQGTGYRNPFGEDFEKEGKIWTESLCRKDSDGDGLTNGQELGDPNCVWTDSTIPSRQTGLSHPGVCDPWDSPACFSRNISHPRYHTQEEWMRDMCKPDEFICPGLNDTDVHTLNISLPEGTKVPAKPTTYMCQIYDFENLAPHGDYQLIAVEPLLVNKYVVHHMVLFGCSDDQVASGPFECGMVASQRCQEFLSVWTVGLAGDCSHPQAGIRVGTNGYKRMAIQFHWNNPESRSDWVDSSGMMLHYTANSWPRLPTTGHDYLRLATTTYSWPRLPTTGHDYLRLATTTYDCPRLPTTGHDYLRLATTTYGWPRLPTTVHDYLRLATTTYGWPRLPTAGHDYLRLATTTYGWPRLPTTGHDYLRPATTTYGWPRLPTAGYDLHRQGAHTFNLLRQYDAGILVTGLQIFVLPPRQPSITLKSTCTSGCTRKKFKGTVWVTTALDHMHYAGRKMSIQVFRNNTAVTYLSNEPIYSYDSPQVQQYTDKPVQLLAGDELVTTCTYDTTSRVHSTLWGEATSDEMCFGFLTYYPKENMDDSFCLSGGPDISNCDSSTYRGCTDFVRYANPVWLNTSSVYQSLLQNCRPFTPCLQECVQTIVDLKRNNPCFQDELFDYMKNQLLDYNPLGKDFMARFTSCERQVYSALNPPHTTMGARMLTRQ
ncbi:hypothetical protein Btru_069965 [Bulinus truncatus]|nr:hypothetical protein Btru_069965 [Bulinus truncatus]